MTVEELLRENNIRLPSIAEGRHYTTCPRCSAGRKTAAHRKAKVLGVKIDGWGACWVCSHCNWRGPEKGEGNGAARNDAAIAAYPYHDERGVLIRQKFRGANKKFWWGRKLSDKKVGIYRLPDVIKAIAAGQRIAVVEGERDADNLWNIGVPATCSPDGAPKPGQGPKWRVAYSEMLRGADIVVMGDNDEQGRTHMAATACMSAGIAARVCTLNLAQHWPEIPEGGDISDWLEAGHTRQELIALWDQAPEWPPKDHGADAEAKQKADAETQRLIDELARLDQLDYEKRRREAAREQGIRSSALDDAVGRRRDELAAERGPPPLFGHWVVEPWPEAVDGDALLLLIVRRIRRHVILTEAEAITVALWVLMAWAHQAAVFSPILLITSAEANSGKSTLLGLISFLVPRGLSSVGISPGALYRAIEKFQPTILVDEGDTAFLNNDDLRTVINSSWDKSSSSVLRCVGERHEPHLFPTFVPKVIGMKGRKLADTTLSRCIDIGMRRKKPSERIEDFKREDDTGLEDLRRQGLRWSIDDVEALKIATPEMPAGFDNRLRNNWALMLAIADLAGGEWPERARQAAISVSNVVGAADASTGARLLADIKGIFEEKGVDRLPSSELVIALGAMEDRPWIEWKGEKPITANQLARLLRPFGVVPDSIRVGNSTPKGYYLAHFQDAFERYLQGAP
jgi:putative DNA primase/helicase